MQTDLVFGLQTDRKCDPHKVLHTKLSFINALKIPIWPLPFLAWRVLAYKTQVVGGLMVFCMKRVDEVVT